MHAAQLEPYARIRAINEDKPATSSGSGSSSSSSSRRVRSLDLLHFEDAKITGDFVGLLCPHIDPEFSNFGSGPLSALAFNFKKVGPGNDAALEHFLLPDCGCVPVYITLPPPYPNDRGGVVEQSRNATVLPSVHVLTV